MEPENTGASLDALNQPIPVLGVEPATEPTPEVTTPEPVENQEDEVTRLQRIIATDPQLRQTYAQDYYGPQPTPQPQPQYQPPQPAPQPQPTQQLPFNPEEYNPYNLEHQAALTEFVVQQAVAPAMQFIQNYQQQEQVQQQTYQEQQAKEQMSERQKILEKHVPGFTAWTQQTASPEQLAVASFADREYLRLLSTVDPKLQNDIRVQQHIITQIAPKVKALASKLGASSLPVTSSSVYVEGAQRVPTSNANPFDDAFKNDDTLGMIKALKTT